MTYDNTNRGAIWKNDDKREDSHPDFKGSLNVGGVEYWVSAWKRKEGAAGKSPALSFSVKPKDEQPQRAPQRDALKGQVKRSTIPDDDMGGDAIPF